MAIIYENKVKELGKDIMMIPKEEIYFTVNVDVHISNQFLGWVFSLGDGVKIISPDEVVEQMKQEVERLQKQYF